MTVFRRAVLAAFALLVLLSISGSTPAAAAERGAAEQPAESRDDALVADWIRQAELRLRPGAESGRVAPEEDAAGGCDGIKNGQWGFHTLHEVRPWWQVDLERRAALDRIEIYNRTDFAARSARIRILLSEDGRTFEPAYEHDGTVFLGHADGKPLRVEMGGKPARYVRLELPSTDYFHLDEVEVYAAGSAENIALGRPSTQSSTSQWSVRRAGAGAPLEHAARETVRRGLRLAEHLS
ncbi:MAG: discoidin domain-containing protein, partial [Planctomycetes bacterium]|nr:discoidin domain-containing protein [Planctomycetota bacterium]